jgi:hypothetical protein
MERSDWILVLLGAPTAEGATRPLDPVRIMKGLFLLIEEGHLEDPPTYEFEPYHYGPVSLQVYDDLAELVEEGLIEALAVPGYSWKKYQLSFRGANCADELRAELPPSVVPQIDKVKNSVSSLSFRALLRYVYGNYPEYAVNSVIGRL